MNMKENLLKTSFIVILNSFLLLQAPKVVSADSTACDCIPVSSVMNSKDSSTHVFVGEIRDISLPKLFEKTLDNSKSEVSNEELSTEYFLVKVRVKRFWKGHFQEEILLRTAKKPEDCGYNFAAGNQYLIYATGGKLPVVNSCSRTSSLDSENAKNDIRHLGEAQSPDLN